MPSNLTLIGEAEDFSPDGESDSTDTEDEDEDFSPDSEDDSTDESFSADSYDDELTAEIKEQGQKAIDDAMWFRQCHWQQVVAELPAQCAMHGPLPPGAEDWMSRGEVVTKLAALLWRLAQEQPADLQFHHCSLACLPQ